MHNRHFLDSSLDKVGETLPYYQSDLDTKKKKKKNKMEKNILTFFFK